MELGEYDYDNYTLTNPEIVDIDMYSLTSVHEYTHMILSMQSSIGMLSYCLKRIVPPTEKCEDYRIRKNVSEFLSMHYIKVQEGMAVFSEFALIILGVVSIDCDSYLMELKHHNRDYYKYVEPLIPIIKLMQREKDKNQILETYFWVYECALYAMNTDVKSLKPELLRTNSSLQKLVSSDGFSEAHLPNTRFKNALKVTRDAKDCKDVSTKISEYLKGKNVLFSSSLDEGEKNLKDIKEFVLEIFADSQYIENYRIGLKNIHCEEVSVKEAYTRQLALIHDDEIFRKYSKRSSYDEIKENIDNKHAILFFLGDALSTAKQAFRYEIDEEILNEYIELSKELLFLYLDEPKSILGAALTNGEISEILTSADIPIVINYKAYDFSIDDIIGHVCMDKDIFIYCDRTYQNFKPFYKFWVDRCLYYRWLVYSQLSVLIICLRDNRFLLLPVTAAVGYEAQSDINRRDNLIEIEGEDTFDDIVLTSERKDKIDYIVSYLLFRK